MTNVVRLFNSKYRPYGGRPTADLRLDRNYWWSLMTAAAKPADEHFAAMRLFEIESELRHRGERFHTFRAPPPARDHGAPAA
jgi:hypothetical protein